jgi:hypothetical protein
VTYALSVIQNTAEIVIVQKKELAELFGFETRTKYSIEANGTPFAYAAEQGKSGIDFVARYFLGHWRTFEIHFFDDARELVFRALHPFRFLFQRLEVVAADGRPLGAVQQRWAFLSKRFDVLDANGSGRRVLFSLARPSAGKVVGCSAHCPHGRDGSCEPERASLRQEYDDRRDAGRADRS